ncbi:MULTISPECIES: Rv1476 family membrane protein, partial [Nocardiaceae]|uniref:Rv1476 family membrane protein n=1 Tax=Nocardiaceae TaxID=85025 RepID=UPI00050CD0E1
MTEPIHVVSPLATDIPAGLDVDSIVATVRESGVSAPAAEQDGLTAAVNRAEDHGIDLSIVIVPDEPRHDSQLRDLATAVGAREGGTVLVLSPGQVGTFSDSISRVTLEAGQDRTYTGNHVVAADNFVDTLVEDQTPWGLLTGGLVVIVAAVAALTAAVKVRRYRARSATADPHEAQPVER